MNTEQAPTGMSGGNPVKLIPDLKLIHQYILVKPIKAGQELQEQIKGGIIIPETVGEGQRAVKGIVLAYADDCKHVKQRDKIAFFMYAVTEIELDKDKFLLISEKDVMAILGKV